MAERRMFSKKIVDSDEFLDMPIEAQNLYFHLAMRADDDGFVNSPKRILRFIGVSVNALNTLVEKKFIIAFDSGIVAIRHWKVHNYIAKDRYKSTFFIDEKKQLQVDENGVYTLCTQSVYNLYTQDSIGKDSLDKDSLGEGRIEEERIDEDSLDEGRIVENRNVSLTAATAATREKDEGCFSMANSREEDICNHDSLIPTTDTKEEMRNILFRDNIAEGYSKNTNNSEYEKEKVGDSPDKTIDEKKLKPRLNDHCLCAIYLSDEQYDDLKKRLGKSELDRYMEKLSSFIINKGARIKSHYDTILKWYEEDSQVSYAPSKHPTVPEKPRYGSFDYKDAFHAALKRSYGEDYERLKFDENSSF